ncbi:MAG TPA: lysozyme [Caulobacteraceae bacterium]|nr:lysozyme [Caulobacteraceae bacterium]
MSARHKVSRAALELIEHFEGYRRQAARLADGRWTIGFGHTLTAREGAEVSRDDAEALLLYDVRPIAAAINELVYTPLTQNQFDALVAFAFNIGLDNFRASAVLRRVNEGNLIQAAFALEMWRKAEFQGEPIVVDALVRRRAAEKTLFLTPTGGWVAAPTPVLRPRLDFDAATTAPQSATELDMPLTGETAEAYRAPATRPEGESASMAAVNAMAARLNAILPEPEPEPHAEADVNSAPAADAGLGRETAVAPEPSEPVADGETPPSYAYLTGPTLFGPLLAPEAETPPAQIHAEPAEPAIEPPPEPAVEHEPLDLSRRVVWREAPPEVEDVRPTVAKTHGLPLAALAALGLLGLAIFAGAITWGMNASSSSAVSWGLGLVGIACVVSAVYIYLERLGRPGE